jgi:hypothetical protein
MRFAASDAVLQRREVSAGSTTMMRDPFQRLYSSIIRITFRLSGLNFMHAPLGGVPAAKSGQQFSADRYQWISNAVPPPNLDESSSLAAWSERSDAPHCCMNTAVGRWYRRV